MVVLYWETIGEHARQRRGAKGGFGCDRGPAFGACLAVGDRDDGCAALEHGDDGRAAVHLGDDRSAAEGSDDRRAAGRLRGGAAVATQGPRRDDRGAARGADDRCAPGDQLGRGEHDFRGETGGSNSSLLPLGSSA